MHTSYQILFTKSIWCTFLCWFRVCLRCLINDSATIAWHVEFSHININESHRQNEKISEKMLVACSATYIIYHPIKFNFCMPNVRIQSRFSLHFRSYKMHIRLYQRNMHKTISLHAKFTYIYDAHGKLKRLDCCIQIYIFGECSVGEMHLN